jgi:hypothetical protein
MPGLVPGIQVSLEVYEYIDGRDRLDRNVSLTLTFFQCPEY